MRSSKYISLNLLSLNSYLIIMEFLYVCGLYSFLNKVFSGFIITTRTLCSIYILFMFLNILLIILFCIEKYIRRIQPNLLIKINFKNKTIKKIHHAFFYFGYYFGVFITSVSLILFLIFLTF